LAQASSWAGIEARLRESDALGPTASGDFNLAAEGIFRLRYCSCAEAAVMAVLQLQYNWPSML
jgi:hypothetical protein